MGRQMDDSDSDSDNDNAWEDGIPWIDVSFDGTWQKRGFTSHYGVGVVIDVLTGYVVDYEVLSTYCHACRMNGEKLEEMTEDQQAEWERQHEPHCARNHEGSSKAMERDAALVTWRRSEEKHNLCYRTMLSDRDSVAFTAVSNDMPYGPNRPIKKRECVNHVHKRMGTALRKAAQDGKLGGRGQGKLTKDKCVRLQNYYRGAVLNNLNMKNAIWATAFHCISTDEHLFHRRCPEGDESWCFYKKALALGEEPRPHHEKLRTFISRPVFQGIEHVYRRMTSDVLLQRVSHGKTQNANESLNNLIWVHCPKERFVGRSRLSSAVTQAVSKFNRENSHLAQVLDNLSLPLNEKTLQAVADKDQKRIAGSEAELAQRRVARVNRRLEVAHQEQAEGELYGPGMMQEDLDN